MKLDSNGVIKTYVTLTLLSTFASSFIWGVNTLFLLSAGLSITEAFAANAFFTAGQVLFEVPTGLVADTRGRRLSYLLGTVTLFLATLGYLFLWSIHAPFWMWAVSSATLGLGFTFFSGATEAWLVDALKATKYPKSLEHAFGMGQVAGGIAMLTGTVFGGVVAQYTSLAVPYILRIVMLGITFIVAFILMHDIGFKPRRSTSVMKEVKQTLSLSLDYGIKRPATRWLMLAAPISAGLGFYAFYAMQPYLLELYGNPKAYAVAGAAAAIVAGAQIVGGILAPRIRTIFAKRSSFLIIGTILSAASLVAIGLLPTFWIAIFFLVLWAIIFASIAPIRQALFNDLIPSQQRATVLSSDNLLASAGGVVIQPALGQVAEVHGYGSSYVVGGILQLLVLPFLFLLRRTHAPADTVTKTVPEVPLTPQ